MTTETNRYRRSLIVKKFYNVSQALDWEYTVSIVGLRMMTFSFKHTV